MQERPVRGYRDLAALLRDQILTGRLSPGAALPSERQLVQTYGLGRGTVADALAMLRAEGLIVSRRGYAATVVAAPEPQPLPVEAGDRVTTRMPTQDEREQLGIPDGQVVPVFWVQHPNRSGQLYRGDDYYLPID